MWLTILPVFGSLLSIAASQSCPEDSALLVRLKPLGQCKDGENTCPYLITIPTLTIQLPKSFSELEKMSRELEHLTHIVNQLKDDCQECKERQRLPWNIRTAERGNGERIQASRGNLNTRERQQDITKRVGLTQHTTGKPAEEDTMLSIPTKETNLTDVEKQKWNNQLRYETVNPSTTRLTDKISRGPTGLKPSQKRITQIMSKVGKKTLPTAEERRKLSQYRPSQSHHGKHKSSGIKFWLGRHTSGNVTKDLMVESIPKISEVTNVSKVDNTEPNQPIQSTDDKILGEMQHASDIKEQNDRKLTTNMTKLSRTPSKQMEDKEEVSDTELTDKIPFIFDGINGALESSASVMQRPTYKNKDSEADIGVDSKPVNIVDMVSGLKILRSPTLSDGASVTASVNQIISQFSGGHLVNAPAVDEKSSRKPQQSGQYSVSAPAMDKELSGTPQPSGGYTMRAPAVAEESSGMPQPSVDQELSAIPQTDHSLKTPAVHQESSQMPQPRATLLAKASAIDQETGGNPQPRGVHPLRTPVVQQNRSVMSQPSGQPTLRALAVVELSGVLPVSTPAMDHETSGSTQLSAKHSVKATAVDLESSGMSQPIGELPSFQKTNAIPPPSGKPNVGAPDVNQKSTGKPQPSGIFPVRVPAVDQESSGIPQPSGVLTFRTPTVQKKTNGMLQPSGKPTLMAPAMVQESGGIPQLSEVLPGRAPDMDQLTSGISKPSGILPFRAPALQKKTNVTPWPSGKLTLRYNAVDQQSSGIPQGSGVLPVRAPAVNHESSGLSQPTGSPALGVPPVDLEGSVTPKPSGVFNFRIPVLEQKSSGNTQPRDLLPAVDQKISSMPLVKGVPSMRTPSGEQETSNMPHHSKLHSMKSPVIEQKSSNKPLPRRTSSFRNSVVEQKMSSLPQPTGQSPVRAPVLKRFKSQENTTVPKYIKHIERTHPTRTMVAKKLILKKTYILQRIQGNESMETFPETKTFLSTGRLRNTSRVPGYTTDLSSGIKQVDSKASPSSQNKSASTMFDRRQSLAPTMEETSSRQKEFNYLTTATTWYRKLMKETEDKHSIMTPLTRTTAETPQIMDPENVRNTPRVKVLDKPVDHRPNNTNMDGASRSSSGKKSDSDLGSRELHLDFVGSGKVTVLQPSIQNRTMDPKHGAMDITESTGTHLLTSTSENTLDRYSQTPLKAIEPLEVVYSGDGQSTDGSDGKSYLVAKDRTVETEAALYKMSSKLTIMESTKNPLTADNVGGKEGFEKQLVNICNGKCDLRPSPQLHLNIHKSSADEKDKPAQDCSEITTRTPSSGIFNLTVSENCTFSAVCDMKVAGGGWTLIQRRMDGSVSFSRTWDEYKNGFGSLSGEFWLGNDKIHQLTSAKTMVLHIELEDLDGIKEYAQYNDFHVANESQHYRLTIGGYSGTAGNAMQYSKKFNHDQKYFSTPDRDNDQYPSGNCGAFYSSGWWFDACMAANLNGRYYQTRYKGVRNGIFWGTWHNISTESYPTTDRQAFKTVRMMIRPRAGYM